MASCSVTDLLNSTTVNPFFWKHACLQKVVHGSSSYLGLERLLCASWSYKWVFTWIYSITVWTHHIMVSIFYIISCAPFTKGNTKMRFLRAYCSTIWHFVFCNKVTHRHLSQSCSSSIHNIMTVYRWTTLLRLLYLRFHTYMLIIASVHCPNLSMWDVLNSADMITPARKTQLSFQLRRTSCHKCQNFDNSIQIIITGAIISSECLR